MIILITIYIALYLIINIIVSNKIKKAYYMNENRRKFHLRFIWYIPIFGALIIRNHWKTKRDKPLDVVLKEDRKPNRGGFYESGAGSQGGGID